MRRRRSVVWHSLILFALSVLLSAGPVFAATEPEYKNPETGYAVYLDDVEGLVETEKVLEAMIPVTAYGGAAFVSASPEQTSDVYAEQRYREFFGSGSGTLFLIDMNNRYLWIYSDGAVYEVVTGAYADTITDNVYRYATDGNYTACAVRAFEQIHTLLLGGRITQPMKHISNTLLALLTGLSLNFLLMVSVSQKEKPLPEELAKAGAWHAAFSHTEKQLKSET
ncbi:MAG: TPM domain-containing protein, partial [Lachnospiraceae bacterium]|nr:TPM domain-containing protein [Lachnospiraceae bacterium]